MDRLRVDFRNILNLDVPRRGRRVPGGPPRRRCGGVEQALVSTAVSGAARLSNRGRILNEVVELADAGRRIPVSLIGGRGSMVFAPPTSSVVTVGVGSSVSAFAAIGITFGAGLYGSTKPELGIYTSGGGGIWTNAGVSASLQVTFVFGPPSDFGGMSWGVGVGCDIPGVGLGVSAMVLFSASGPPYRFLGFSYGLGAGVSVLPVEYTFQVSSTHLRRLTP
jgi:hypothetical protein